MQRLTKCLSVAALVIFITLAQTAGAHELKNTTARVELRDNHIRILIDTQVLDWLALLGNETRTFDSKDIPARLTLAKQTLRDETLVRIDKGWAEVRVLDLPKEKDILAMLEHFAWVQERGKPLPHGFGWTTLQLEAVIETTNPKTIHVSFPASLGETGITFSQPTSQWVQPAQSASFATGMLCKQPPPKTTPSTSGLTSKWIGLAALLLLFAVLARRGKSNSGAG